MHLYEKDKAIEFNALYKDIERTIKSLKSIGIDVSEEEKSAKKIKKMTEENISSGAVQMAAETNYSEGIKKLNELKELLGRHEIYFSSYTSAVSIENEIDKSDLDKERISAFAKATIVLLNQIQSSDTRAYNSEKVIVEKIYNLAYNIIKLEIVNSGKSIVLDWVKNDKVASSFINSIIETELALLNENEITNDLIRETLNTIKKSGIVASYLDEGLILFLAMQKGSSLERVEKTLLTLIKDIASFNERIEETNSNNNSLEDRINELKQTIKKSRIYKELGLTVSLIALLLGLKYGSEKTATLFGHNEYKTETDYFSTSVDSVAPEYPEYMSKINNGFSETTLTAYDVWHQENIFFGEYQRDIVTYNLNDIDIESLEDFLSYDFSGVKSSGSTTETREELDANELYDKAIIEIIRISQDENDAIFVPNEETQEIFLIVMSVVGAIIGGLGSLFILSSIIKKFKNSHQTRILKKEQIKEWKAGLEHYKRLCNENEEFKNRFLEMYQKFSQFIKNPKINEEYERILKNK